MQNTSFVSEFSGNCICGEPQGNWVIYDSAFFVQCLYHTKLPSTKNARPMSTHNKKAEPMFTLCFSGRGNDFQWGKFYLSSLKGRTTKNRVYYYNVCNAAKSIDLNNFRTVKERQKHSVGNLHTIRVRNGDVASVLARPLMPGNVIQPLCNDWNTLDTFERYETETIHR